MDAKNQNERELPEGTDESVQRIQDATSGLIEQAKSAAQTRVTGQVSAASDGLQHAALAIRQSGQNLREQDQAQVATLADSAAGQVERVAGYLQGRDARQLMTDAESMARREPVLFLAGGLAVGLLAARLFKSSASGGESPSSERTKYDGQTASGVTPTYNGATIDIETDLDRPVV